MIDDDQCRRIMKSFRKRRRQKVGFSASPMRFGTIYEEESGGFQSPGKSRVRRKTTASLVLNEKDENENIVRDLTYPSSHCHQNFWHFLIRQYDHAHRDRNRENQQYSRRDYITWGESLARRRAFAGVNQKDKSRETASPFSPGPELVYRKPENFHTSSYYSNCTFLDSYDKVMAIDNRGTLDLIRLADIRSQLNLGGKKMKKATAPAPNVKHDKIVTNFELGSELLHPSFSTVHVQALSGGHTVAFGLEDDSLCLLDLNRRTSRCFNDRKIDNEVLTPVSLSTAAHTSSTSPLLAASRTNHPLRTHYRDRRNPKLSLHEMCRHLMNRSYTDNQTTNIGLKHSNNVNLRDNDDLSELHAIDYTNGRKRIASPVRFSNDARWDIFEVHPSMNGTNSLLYVAHVDSDYDAFWTQVLDHRERASTTSTKPNGDGKRYNATTILVDGTTRDRPGKTEEHVTSCAFISDICMATAHISCGKYGSTPPSEFFDRGLPYTGNSGMSSCIKLWDLRMVKKRPNDYPLPSDTILFPACPSFQHADFAVFEPSETIQVRSTSVEGSLAFSGMTFTEESCKGSDLDTGRGTFEICSDHIITNISAARHSSNSNGGAHSGSLIVTTQSRTESSRIDHCKLDLSNTIRMTRKISQINSNLGCRPVYAISSSHKYLATCSNIKKSETAHSSDETFSRISEASTRLCLYDLHQTSPRITKSSAFKDHAFSSPLRLCQQQREDPTWSFRTDAHLADRYGVKTELSCSALNSNGTALLGGTMDGDLFVWRGV